MGTLLKWDLYEVECPIPYKECDKTSEDCLWLQGMTKIKKTLSLSASYGRIKQNSHIPYDAH